MLMSDQDHRLAQQRSGREVLEDQERADDPEDRAGGADRDGERAELSQSAPAEPARPETK